MRFVLGHDPNVRGRDRGPLREHADANDAVRGLASGARPSRANLRRARLRSRHLRLGRRDLRLVFGIGIGMAVESDRDQHQGRHCKRAEGTARPASTNGRIRQGTHELTTPMIPAPKVCAQADAIQL